MVTRYNEDGSITDGTFDDVKTSCRERFANGIHKYTISKMWIETTNQEFLSRLEDWMKEPWGTYPPLPPRMKK
jgi:hypothetical protein